MPLLQPVTGSQVSPVTNGAAKQTRMRPKRVGVPEIDQAFADMAETFNKQQEHYETMAKCLADLKGTYQCSHGDSLSDCMRKIRDEHGACSFSLEMKGYDVALVLPPGPACDGLQKTREHLSAMCLSAKDIVVMGTKLQEMMGWVLQSDAEFTQQVRNTALTYLDQRRVEANLRDDLQEVRRAMDQSKQYRQEADYLLNEVAQLAGVNLCS